MWIHLWKNTPAHFDGNLRLPAVSTWRATFRRLALGAAVGLLTLGNAAETAAAVRSKGPDDFMPYVELAPFVVQGRQQAVSIYARSKRDRRYAEKFAEDVVKVAYEAVTESTGKGLVIIGQKGEPHPILVFRKFLALAKEGKLDPAVAARGPELHAMLDHWQSTVGDGKSAGADGSGGVDLEFEKIITALPLPLEGVGARLYQLAWAEGFDDAKVEARLRGMPAADLEGSLFTHFDWVFYLPPRGVFEQVIDDLVADALKEDGEGFMARTLVKGAMLVVKPKIRKAIEGMRRGVLLATIARARAGCSEEQVSALTEAYMEVMMPDHKNGPGTEHDQAVRAVREKIRSLNLKPADSTAAPAEAHPEGG